MARQTEAVMAQQTQAAMVQPKVTTSVTQNSQFYPQSSFQAAAPLFHGPDFTNTPVFQWSNLTLPPPNVGRWNQNQYIGPQSSPASNDIQLWAQNPHHNPQSSPLQGNIKTLQVM